MRKDKDEIIEFDPDENFFNKNINNTMIIFRKNNNEKNNDSIFIYKNNQKVYSSSLNDFPRSSNLNEKIIKVINGIKSKEIPWRNEKLSKYENNDENIKSKIIIVICNYSS